MEKVAKNGRKVKAIALLKMLKMDEKLRLWPYFFAVFRPLMKYGKSPKNARKVKAIALLFCWFFGHLWKKSLKMDEKLRL